MCKASLLVRMLFPVSNLFQIQSLLLLLCFILIVFGAQVDEY